MKGVISMKKYNKYLSLLLAFAFFFSTALLVQAENKRALTVNFSDFKFVTSDYNSDDVRIEYHKDGLNESALIIDKAGKLLETISVKAIERKMSDSQLRIPDVYPYTFTRSVSYGATTVQFSMNVELYNRGSFRSINSYQGGYVGITSSVTHTYLEGSNHNAWSPSGFPTTELYYAFNGTIVAEVERSTSSEVKAELLGAGFSVNETVKDTTYYRRSFDSNGIIELYH